MTTLWTNRAHSSAYETARFASTLVAMLRDTPSTSKALAKSTGFTVNYINSRLTALANEGRAVREGHSLPRGGKEYVWSVPVVAEAVKPAYPAWEVLAAFYGTARREAA